MIPPASGHLQFRHPDGYFLLRVAGIARRGDDVLLHRAEDDDFWSLPGGRVLFGEAAEEALVREMLEEIGYEVEVGPLVVIVENFFIHEQLDRALDETGEVGYHEMGLYFHIEAPGVLMDRDEFSGTELAGTDREFRLEFRWFHRNDLTTLDVRPVALREVLALPFTPVLQHIVNRG